MAPFDSERSETSESNVYVLPFVVFPEINQTWSVSRWRQPEVKRTLAICLLTTGGPMPYRNAISDQRHCNQSRPTTFRD
uniref:Uncharacterized protein n=1 Tax=Panagrellus redivivus TaxID=6233 RepID=A0A7E4ZYF5_PANRE